MPHVFSTSMVSVPARRRWPVVLVAAAVLLLGACGDEDTPPNDVGVDADPGVDVGGDTAEVTPEECPAGPEAPLGVACETTGLRCAYGYDPIECGGRTVICQDGSFVEESHTDPQPGCFDG